MTDLVELYPGFATQRIRTDGAEIHVRTGGSGAPLLLLHGYPQTGVCWHKIAPALAEHFTLVIPDLRGYGHSSVPPSDAAHLNYSKRVMAADNVAVMRALGHERFMVLCHDRGARVGYRLTLDHPTCVERLVTLDIVPTWSAWADATRLTSLGRFHWPFLAQPHPFPETLINKDPDYFLEHLIASWTETKSLAAFDPRAMAHYRANYRDPKRVEASCEDYRAGATIDVDYDAADREAGRKITCPMLALWGAKRENSFSGGPLDIWKDWATDVRGKGIISGHFLPEEKPVETLAEILPFLKETTLTT